MAQSILTAVLAPQHWRIVVLGVAHAGGPASAQVVRRLLDVLQPSILCVELDRRDFARHGAALSPAASPAEAAATAEAFERAVPEVDAALRWAAAGREGAGVRVAVPIDRDQLTTRRRLALFLAQQPGQLFRSRRFFGELPDARDGAAIAAWRHHVRVECPALHDVLLEERDEYMSYQILLRLDARIAARAAHASSTVPSGSSAAAGDTIEKLLQARSARATARLRAAMQWALDGPALGSGGLRAHPEWADTAASLPPLVAETVVVLCGPAHVDGITTRLRAALGDEGGAEQRRFLAQNSTLFPNLLCTVDGHSAAEGASEAELAREVAASLGGPQGQGGGGLVGEAATSHRWGDHGLGPLTSLVVGFCSKLGGLRAGAGAVEGVAGAAIVPAGSLAPVFVHDRLRDLSRQPLPVWPAFIAAYVFLPFTVFVIIPAKLDMWWLGEWLRPKVS